jgi:hypothetical protein
MLETTGWWSIDRELKKIPLNHLRAMLCECVIEYGHEEIFFLFFFSFFGLRHSKILFKQRESIYRAKNF